MPRVFDFTDAILRHPAASAVHGLRAGQGSDPSLAGLLAEHAAYANALRGAGLAVSVLEPLEDFPDALFVEDPALVFPGAAILLNPGAPSRAGEGAFLRGALAARFDRVLELAEGHADGGDVLVMPDKVFIGLSARTDRTGAAALAGLLRELGYHPVIAETPAEVLHLKTASSLIDEETVLATRVLAASGIFSGYRVIEVPEAEEAGANVLRVNADLILSDRFPRIADLLERHLAPQGVRLVRTANAEIEKIDAGFTCMSLRWRAAW